MMETIKDLTELDKAIVIAYANSNMNAAEVARSLRYDNSTVYYHLEKVSKSTGLDPRGFFSLHKLVTLLA